MRLWPAAASRENSVSVTTFSPYCYCERRRTTGGLRAGSATPAEREELHLRKLYHGQLLAHLLDGGSVVLRAENRGACDEGIGAGPRDLGDVLGLDAAVDLEPDLLAELVDALAHLGDFRQHRADELLPAEARVDRHEQHQVELLQRVVEE